MRVEAQEECPRLGFSPPSSSSEKRRAGVARALLAAGETWLLAHDVRVGDEHGAEQYQQLIRLFEGHGYQIAVRTEEMNCNCGTDVAAGLLSMRSHHKSK
ncbi:MAG: hypothetical protein R3A10_11525 [Caldilineaceae bacterium]